MKEKTKVVRAKKSVSAPKAAKTAKPAASAKAAKAARPAAPAKAAKAAKPAAPAKAAKPAKPGAAKRPAATPGHVVFFTGFPGFIGRRLVAKMLTDAPDVRFQFLVQEKFLAAAKESVASLKAVHPDVEAKVEYLVGDLTVDGLGLSAADSAKVRNEATEVWHLAAVYDLAIGEKIAWNINVEGTRRVLDLCESLTRLQRLVYFSTCYVSGLRTGLILEDDLDLGQGFKNHYESTKFEAEALVRQRRDRIPTIIIRPSVVIGDTRTGETDKYDGPYFLIRFLADAEQRGLLGPFKHLPVPSLGPGRAFFNLVPVDYLVEATWHIVRQPAALGKVFAVCDPDPLTAREFYDEVWQAFGLNKTWGVLPTSLVALLTKTPVLGAFMYIPEQAVPYGDHYAVYDCKNTLDFVKDADIKCPHLRTYLPTMIGYVKQHLEKTGKYAKY